MIGHVHKDLSALVILRFDDEARIGLNGCAAFFVDDRVSIFVVVVLLISAGELLWNIAFRDLLVHGHDFLVGVLLETRWYSAAHWLATSRSWGIFLICRKVEFAVARIWIWLWDFASLRGSVCLLELFLKSVHLLNLNFF